MADSSARADARRDRQSGYAFIAVLWLLIYLRGYPAPFIDDLFFTGAAFNLAVHNVYANPFCPSLAALDSSGMFLAYMPLHSYVLAGWLKLFGLSFVSLSLFSTLTSALVCALIYRLMPVRGRFAQAALATGIVALVFLLLGGAGLRADSLGLVFFFFGIDAARCRHAGLFFLKNLALALTVITFPNLAVLSLLISVSTLIYRKDPWLVVWTGLAYVVAFLLLLACIDFRLGDLLHSLRLNQHYGSIGVEERNANFFSVYHLAKWFAIQTAFVVCMLLFVWRERDQENRTPLYFLVGTALAGFAALFWASLNSASGAHVWAFGCLIFSLYALASRFWRPAWILAWWLFVGVFLYGHGHTAVEDLFCRHRVDAAANQILAAKLRASPEPIYVDCYAIRELFDYRLPANARGFETSSTTGWGGPISLATLPPGPCVVSVKNTLPGAVLFPAGRKWESLRLFGHTIAPLCENPYDLTLMSPP